MTWPLPEAFMVGACAGFGWGFIIGVLVAGWLAARRPA